MTFKTAFKADAWVVVADGKSAQVLEERRRHGPLSRLEDWTFEAPEADRHRTKPGGTVFERAGGGRHGVQEGSPTEEAEVRFLKNLAEKLDVAAETGRFDRLVLIAPPKALGRLRRALGHAAQAVEAVDPHKQTREPLDALRLRLRELRLPA